MERVPIVITCHLSRLLASLKSLRLFYPRGSKSFDMPYQTKAEPQRFDSIEQLLNSDVEVISVTTPPSSHYQFAKQCILAGKHVIVEKPFCNTLAEVEDLYQLAQAHNVKITPYQNRRYDSDFFDDKEHLTASKSW